MKSQKRMKKKKKSFLQKTWARIAVIGGILCIVCCIVGTVFIYSHQKDVLGATTTRFGYGSVGVTGNDIAPEQYLNQLQSKKIQQQLNKYKNGYSLSQYTPPVVSQGNLNACVSFAVGYYAVGWYAKRGGYYPSSGLGGFAPMYLYSQIARANGGDKGTTPQYLINNYLVPQGIDTRQDYQSSTGNPDTNWWTLPSAKSRTNASNFKIAGMKILFQDKSLKNLSTAKIDAIKTALIAGDPVLIDVSMPANLMDYTFGKSVMAVDGGVQHGHELFIDGFTSQGASVINSWGPSWGKNGRAIFPWKYLVKYTRVAFTIVPKGKPQCTIQKNGQCVKPAPKASTSKPNQALCKNGTVCMDSRSCKAQRGTIKNACNGGYYCCTQPSY